MIYKYLLTRPTPIVSKLVRCGEVNKPEVYNYRFDLIRYGPHTGYSEAQGIPTVWESKPTLRQARAIQRGEYKV